MLGGRQSQEVRHDSVLRTGTVHRPGTGGTRAKDDGLGDLVLFQISEIHRSFDPNQGNGLL